MIKEFKFGDIELELNNYSKGYMTVVEKCEYKNLDYEILTLPRAILPDYYLGKKKNVMQVNVDIRIIFRHNNKIKMKKEASSFINSLEEQDLNTLKIETLHCEAVLKGVEQTILNNTMLLSLEFINFNGEWYGEKKPFGANNLEINRSTNQVEMLLIPNQLTNIKISDTSTGEFIKIESLQTKDAVYIDFYEKTVKQNNKHVPITIDSDFFKFTKDTKLEAENCMVAGGYKEVEI